MNLFPSAKFIGQLALALACLAPQFALSQTSETEASVPHNLLKLIHTSEVQRELGLEGDNRLLGILKDLDRVWWPARILPEAKQVGTIRALEAKLLDDQQLLTIKTAFAETDALSLKRIYPLAPELTDSGEWAGSGAQLWNLSEARWS